MNQIKLRGITSLLLMTSFIIESITGIGLYLAPSGRIANTTNWTFIGINKFKLENLHTIWGFIMIGLITLHLILNYKLFINEIKILIKKK